MTKRACDIAGRHHHIVTQPPNPIERCVYPVMVYLQGMLVVAALALMPPFVIVDDTRAFRQWLAILGCPTKRTKEYLLGCQQPGQQITF